jgi:transcription initiation factor TFIIB
LQNRHLVTDPETGELIDIKTGQVISESPLLSGEKEWRAFGTEKAGERARTGAPVSLARQDSGLSTIIGKTNRDAGGNVLDAGVRSRMARLRTWNARSQKSSPSERNLQRAFDMLARMKDRMALSDPVVEKVAYLYRKALKKKLIQGRTIDSVLAASIYIASRQMDMPRSLEDVSAKTGVSPKDIAGSYRTLVSKLDLRVPATDPVRYIAKVANNLGFSENIKRKALGILKEANSKNFIVGKDPTVIAASVLYVASRNTGEYRTQAEIANTTGVTEATVRNRSKELRKKLRSNLK